MTLRTKTLLITGAMLLGLIALVYLISRLIVLDSFARLEEQIMHQDVRRAHDSLLDRLASLAKTVKDYAIWDDTYAFMAKSNQDYITSNFVDDLFNNMRLNVIVLVQPSGQIAFAKGYDLSNNATVPAPADLLDRLGSDHALLQKLTQDESASGFVVLDKGPMLVTAHAILTSLAKGPSRGTFLMGRYLDAAEIEQMAHITHLSLDVYRLDHVPASLDAGTIESMQQQATSVVRMQDAATIAGYTLLRDITGGPALVLQVVNTRAVYTQGQNTIQYFLAVLLLVTLVYAASVLLFLERSVLTRVAQLSSSVKRIGSHGDFAGRVPEGKGRDDELGQLAHATNTMLAALDGARKAQQEGESLFRAIFDGTPVGMAVVDVQGHPVHTNSALQAMLGYSEADLRDIAFTSFTHPDDVRRDWDLFADMLQGKREHYRIEKRYIAKDGRLIWGDLTVSAVRSADGRLQYTVGMMEDITERRQVEEKLLYMSTHDVLTGLYNRAYFENMLAQLKQSDQYPISIMVLDIDGLKLTNDTQGHAAGDLLLQRTADVLRSLFRQTDIIARVGGDEFAILLPNTANDVAISMLSRLKLDLTDHNNSYAGQPLCLSVGVATASEYGVLPQTITYADQLMYRDKQSHRAVQAIVSSPQNPAQAPRHP